MSPASSSSGATMTCAKLVWRRCAWSNGLRRTSRCLPRSALRIPYAFSPRTVKVADLRPYSSPGLDSITSVLRPRCSAQRRYMRSRISAQSCASVPPASDWIVTTASPPSYSPEKSASSCSRASSPCTSRSTFPDEELEPVLRDVRGELARGALLVRPEVGLCELLLELVE